MDRKKIMDAATQQIKNLVLNYEHNLNRLEPKKQKKASTITLNEKAEGRSDKVGSKNLKGTVKITTSRADTVAQTD